RRRLLCPIGLGAFARDRVQVLLYLRLGRNGSGLWHGIDRLQNAGNDLIGIAFGVRTAIFQIALVTVLDEINRHADRSATIREAVTELVDGLRFVHPRQGQAVIWPVPGDVPRGV